MSDLWDRCRGLIRGEVAAAEWDQCFARLKAWMDSGELYLWVDRPYDDWRRIPVEAQKYHPLIRGAFQRVWARQPRAIHYLETPPNREQILNRRRLRSHREQQKREEALEHEALSYYGRQIAAELRSNPPALPGHRPDRKPYLLRLAETRAMQRLKANGIPLSIRMTRRGRRLPTAPSRTAVKDSGSRYAATPDRTTGAATPGRACPDDGERSRGAADRDFIGGPELRAAMRTLGWDIEN